MKIRGHIKTFLLCVLLCLISLGLLAVSSPEAQFSVSTISPINTAVGYGGLFNPYVFWPGVGLRSAASASLVPFVPFSFGNPFLGFTQTSLGIFNPPFSLSFGFGEPFGGLSSFGFNPLC